MLRRAMLLSGLIALPLLLALTGSASAQDEQPASPDPATETDAEAESPEAPKAVNVTEVAMDAEIDQRLREILRSTEWFRDEAVSVENGVVFLTGTTSDEKYRKWAGDLATRTEDVVAVVNRIKVTEPPILDFSPALAVTRDMGRTVIRSLPLLALSLALLILTWFAARAAKRIGDVTILRRVDTALLREVARKAIAIPVFLLGMFLILRVTGLSQLAMTVVGGTGLFGLVIGIAFRDIAENFLASILLSMQNPFRYGDLIEVSGHTGYVQRVNTRGTLLMTPDGNHVQIPNSDIFKGTIINYTSNPNRRFSFQIGIGYDAPATKAQDTAMEVLREHPAILNDPEPQVLVEQLASSTINLTIYAWVDANQHSLLKVKSSVMRLVLKAFDQAGFPMPDDQREIVFPSGVPVQMLEHQPERRPSGAGTPGSRDGAAQDSAVQARTMATEEEEVTNSAEGDFSSEAEDLREQARKSRDPDGEETDLLESANSATSVRS
ncbi:mechanosensitive ion channel family protein [Fuerstiella marisgermanici]|nr:mechanosensitive ion channel family protein [Fuerstiella marisgermanici]